MAQGRRSSALTAALRALRLVAEASPRQLATAAVFQVLGALAATALVYAAKLSLDLLLSGSTGDGGFRLADLVGPLAVLALATAMTGAVATFQGQQQRLLGEDVGTRTWQELLGVTGRVDLRTMDSPSFAERSERLQTNALNRPLAIAAASLGLLGSALTVAALMAAVLAIEPLLVPVLVVAGIPSIALSRKASGTEVLFARRWSNRYRLRHYYREILSERSFAKEVRAFALQDEVEARHLALSADYRAALAGQVRRRQGYALASALSTALVLALALGVIVWLVDDGAMSLPDAGAAVIAVRLLSGALTRVFNSVGTIHESSVFLSDLNAFVADADVQGGAPPPGLPLRHGIALREVAFRYPETDRDVLTDVDLDIAPGQLVALVGENGSGKSTLAAIVAGLYAPSSGEYRWDDRPVDDDRRARVRRSVSVIFQDFCRYELSAADNVELAPHHDSDRLAAATRAAGIDGVLARLPQGAATILGRTFEGGIDLSGGQWQRIALARALIRDTSLLVLDEPSSALDPRAEHELFTDIRRRAGDRAILLVSHRYANLHLADRIVVLQDGRVVEQGTHEDLIARAGLYAQLYGMQAGAYGAW